MFPHHNHSRLGVSKSLIYPPPEKFDILQSESKSSQDHEGSCERLYKLEGSRDRAYYHGEKVSNGEQTSQQSSSKDTAETFFGKFKSTISSSKGSTAFQRFKEAKFVDLEKKGYDIVKDELHGSPKKRKHLQNEPFTTPQVERSTRTKIVVLPSKRFPLGEKWEALKSKVRGHPVFKRIGVVTDPVVTKSQKIAEDVRERWETSDNHIVHKIQDFNETIFQETDVATTIKEIQSRDLTFSLPEFVTEVQEAIKPVLKAYIKGDVETLKKFCTNEVIEQCKAEHSAYQSHGIFFDNKQNCVLYCFRLKLIWVNPYYHKNYLDVYCFESWGGSLIPTYALGQHVCYCSAIYIKFKLTHGAYLFLYESGITKYKCYSEELINVCSTINLDLCFTINFRDSNA
ncbi:hypothetical protein UlMin_024138 [Ulmus minor]